MEDGLGGSVDVNTEIYVMMIGFPGAELRYGGILAGGGCKVIKPSG